MQASKGEWAFFPMSLCRPPSEGVAQIKDVYHPAYIRTLLSSVWPWTQIHSPQSLGSKAGCVLSCLGLSFSWPLCLKFFMLRFKSEACVFQPPDLFHRYALHFRLVVHSRWSQVDYNLVKKKSSEDFLCILDQCAITWPWFWLETLLNIP